MSSTSALYAETRDTIHAFFYRRLRRKEDAEDLTHDTFLRFERAGYSNDGSDNPKAILLTIARNLLTDFQRRELRSYRSGLVDDLPADALQIASVPSAAPSPEAEVSLRQELRRVHAAIEHLPDPCRTVFLLHRLDGLKHREIGQRMGISISMVEKHIAEAMFRIAKMNRGRKIV